MRKYLTILTKLLPYLIFSIIMFCCYLIQTKVELISPANQPDNLLYLPSGKYLKPLVLGFDQVAADLMWIKAISYFGGHYLSDKDYCWLYHILDLATTLDPYSRHLYEFGGIILSVEKGDVNQSNNLLKKALIYHPDYWRFPFYLGFNYFFYLKDSEKSAYYISKAGTLSDHPPYLPRLAASLYAQAGKTDVAIDFLSQVYDDLEDPWLKKKIRKKITALNQGHVPKSLNEILSKQ